MSGAYDRKSVMRVLAHADEAELAEGLAAAGLAWAIKPVQAPVPKLPGARKAAPFDYSVEAYRAEAALLRRSVTF